MMMTVIEDEKQMAIETKMDQKKRKEQTCHTSKLLLYFYKYIGLTMTSYFDPLEIAQLKCLQLPWMLFEDNRAKAVEGAKINDNLP
jgi:hypothetical protein